MNAKYDYDFPKVCFKYDEVPEEDLQEEGEEEVMSNYIKIEGCENGYLLTLVEFVGDEWDRNEINWVATTTADLKNLLDNIIPDIQREGVE